MSKFDHRAIIKPGIKSVSNTSAQITKLCEPGTEAERSYSDVVRVFDIARRESYALYVLLRLMFDNGLRVSEALQINAKDISFNYCIVVKGLKGSSNRVINASEFKDWLKIYRGLNCNPFSQFDRFFIYRYLKKHGVSHVYQGNVKASVTHQARHLVGQSVDSMNNGVDLIAKVLGHKNLSNTKYYVKKK